MKEQMHIIGEKVLLRPITEADTLSIVNWRNSQSVRNNFVFTKDFTIEMHRRWLETKVAKGEVVQYIIVEKMNEKPVGSVYFRDVDYNNKSAEFGIFVGEESARGKGIGTETTKLFIEYGFNELRLHRIMLRVFSDNIQAIRAYKNAGFEFEGEFRDMIYQNGQYRNMTFMSVINQR